MSLDLTTGTVQDVNNRYTITAPKIITIAMSRNEDAWNVFDFGAGFRTWDFEEQFEVTVDSYNIFGMQSCFTWGNTIDDISSMATPYIIFRAEPGVSPDWKLQVLQASASGNDNPLSVNLVLGTKYYITVTGNSALGANGRITIVIRTGSHTGTIIDTLTTDAQDAGLTYRYFYVAQSRNTGHATRTITMSSENYETGPFDLGRRRKILLREAA